MGASDGGAVFRRMGRNLVWLLGGRGFQAVASLVYLGVAARTLGPRGFGEFSLILAYGQAIANVAQLQSWQTVIRYGMIHLASGASQRLARLLGFTTLLDFVGAALGAAIALLAVPLVAGWLHWNPAEQGRAAWFGVALLLSIGATPTGMLRLVDRFDLITYVQAVGPSVRLAGSLIAWATGAGVDAFLIAWAAAALAQHAATWGTALACSRLPIAFGPAAWRAAHSENQGIWSFMITTNAAGTVSLLTEQLATLAVGGAVGATAAGGYRIAARIARALARPIQIAARIIYPEMARLHARADLATLDHVMARVSRYALALAAAVIVIGVAGGPWLIRLLAGSAYDFAYATLAILAVGVAIDLSGFALEPLLVAHGRAATILRIRLVGAALFTVLLFALLPMLDATAAAIATVMAALLGRIWMGRSVMALPKGPQRF